MTYLYKIKQLRTGEVTYIEVFAPLTIGSQISWKSDKDSYDGLAHWRVLQCMNDIDTTNTDHNNNYDYHVIFTWSGSCFTEHQNVYGVKNRAEAIKSVKEHYGTSVKVQSAKRIKSA